MIFSLMPFGTDNPWLHPSYAAG